MGAKFLEEEQERMARLQEREIANDKRLLRGKTYVEGRGDIAPEGTLEGFIELLCHWAKRNHANRILSREEALVLAWREKLDFDGNGKLSFVEFSKAVRDIGFVGDVKRIFKELDSNRSGQLSFHDLDSAAGFHYDEEMARRT